MNDQTITYRGASINQVDLLNEHNALEKAVKQHNPTISYRGATAQYNELHPEGGNTLKNDAVISYRGATAHQSEL